jgi:hypothetical protein
LPEFKISLLNYSGNVAARVDVIYEDSEAAMAYTSATPYTHCVPVEMWEGTTWVGLVAPGRPSEREARP